MTTKLIRLEMDRGGPIPDHLEKATIYDLDLIRALLGAKLHEEAAEVASAKTPDEILMELGDAWEVLTSIGATYGLKGTDIIMAAEHKRKNRGALIAIDNAGNLYGMLQRPRSQ